MNWVVQVHPGDGVVGYEGVIVDSINIWYGLGRDAWTR